MSTLSSAEFRKTYAKLTEATTVTVNGHPIGIWTPAKVLTPMPAPNTFTDAETLRNDPVFKARYDVRPIRPVPKTRK